jgi:hypothetical protein
MTFVFEFTEFDDAATGAGAFPFAAGLLSFDDEQAVNVKVAATPRSTKNLFLILIPGEAKAIRHSHLIILKNPVTQKRPRCDTRFGR